LSDETPTLLQATAAGVGQKFGQHSWTPIGRWLDGTIISADENGIAMAFDVRPEMVNPAGTLHGGYIALLLDEVIGGSTIIVSNGRFYSTVNLSIDYLAPAQVGEIVTVRATIQRKGRRLWNVQGEITRADGTLVARATSNLIAADI
jgi:acyl-coenzyme A thioesterase 13